MPTARRRLVVVYQPTRASFCAAFFSSFLRSSRPWIELNTTTTTTKKSITPSEKNVITLSFSSPAQPSPACDAMAGAASASSMARVRAAVLKARIEADLTVRGRRPGAPAPGPGKARRARQVDNARHDRRTADLPRRDSQGEPQQVRVRPRHGRDQARPLSVLVDGVSDRLRLHP